MIQCSKLKALFDLKKSISIAFKELCAKGLFIDYKIKGEERTIEDTPLQACSLLKEAGLINKWQSERSKIYLSWEVENNTTDADGNHVQQCKTVYGSFNDFVQQTRLSHWDAICLAAAFESRRIVTESLNNKKTAAV